MDSICIQCIKDTIASVVCNDTLIVRHVADNAASDGGALDKVYKIAMILIGLCNVGFAVYIFFFNLRKNSKKEVKQNRKAMLDSLVLKFKLNNFYDCFGRLNAKSSTLTEKGGDMDIKKAGLDDEYQTIFVDLRIDFIEALGAIDEQLYDNVLAKADDLQSILSKNLFDAGVNLNVKEKYDELIQNPISQYQREILSILYKFE